MTNYSDDDEVDENWHPDSPGYVDPDSVEKPFNLLGALWDDFGLGSGNNSGGKPPTDSDDEPEPDDER
jgi:hypothetical protein